MLEKRRLTLTEGIELSSDENEENDYKLLKEVSDVKRSKELKQKLINL